MLFKDVYLSSHIKMCIVESSLVFMHLWSVPFNDVIFDDGVDKISNIPLMSKIFDDGEGLVPHAYRVKLETLHT